MDGATMAADPLERLQGCVSTVLINIGRTFRDSNQDAKPPMDKSRPRRSELISKANSQFHEALDEVELELVRAREIFERDLSQLRTARKAQERALDLSRQAAAIQTSAADAVPTPVSLSKASPPDALPDTITPQELQHPLDTTKTPSPPKPCDTNQAQSTPGTGTANPSFADSAATITTAPTQQTSTTNAGAAPLAPPSLSNAPALDDFDSIFAHATNSGDFDLDFGTHAMGGSDQFGNAGAGGFDVLAGAAGGGGEGEDINTLLPGLESYVNVDGDGGGGADGYDMIDLPGDGAFDTNGGLGSAGGEKGAAGVNGNGLGAANGAAGDTAMGGTGIGPELSGRGDMDDIFGDMLTMGNGDELGNLVDLNDDWFNT